MPSFYIAGRERPLGMVLAAAGPADTSVGFDSSHTGVNISLTNLASDGISFKTASVSAGAVGWNTTYGITSKTTSDGQVYFEYKINTVNGGELILLGYADNTFDAASFLQSPAMGYTRADARTFAGNASTIVYNSANDPMTSHGAVAGDIIGFAIDFGNGKAWVSYNNSFIGSPTGGTNPTFTWTTSAAVYKFGVSLNDTGAQSVTVQTCAANRSFTPPSGYSMWS